MAAASLEHQGLCKLVSEHPEVLLTLMQRELGMDVPGDVELLPAPETIREIRYPEHHVDSAVVLRRTTGGDLVEALVTEVQRQPDAEKLWSWPILRPLVIGPSQVPSELDLETARQSPELATLAVIMHGRKPESKRLGQVAVQAVKEGLDTDTERYSLLADLIAACLDEQALQEIEDEMELQSTPPFSKWARKHFFEGEDKGRQEGLRRAIALVLGARRLALSLAQQERLARCADEAQLEAWLRRASVVAEVDQLFEPPPTSA